MTQEQIQQMIDLIREVGAELRKSKKKSRQFLIDADIIIEEKKKKGMPPKRSKR